MPPYYHCSHFTKTYTHQWVKIHTHIGLVPRFNTGLNLYRNDIHFNKKTSCRNIWYSIFTTCGTERPFQYEIYSIVACVSWLFCSCSRELLNCFRGLRDWWFQSPPMARCIWGQLILLHICVSSNKTDFHNITELLLKVAFNSYKFLINNFYVIPVKRNTECTQDPTFIQKIYEQTHVPYNSIIPHIFLDMKVRVW